MATVFQARDQVLGIDVALKLLRKEGSSDGRAALARELTVGRRIAHPNVCRLYDTGSTDEYDYLTMELVLGDTLGRVLANGELTQERALAILADVVAALGEAHTLGVVHRDVKPANVMIESPSGRAVLTDFGFALDLDAKQSRRLVGTPAYWAPEQARGEPATARCDVYSFGVLAYRLLARRELSLSDPDAMRHVPRGLRGFVAKCIALRPADRFVDANQACAAFTAARASKWRGRPFVAVAAAAVGGFVLLALPASKPVQSSSSLPTASVEAIHTSVPAPPAVTPSLPVAVKPEDHSARTGATDGVVAHPLKVTAKPPTPAFARRAPSSPSALALPPNPVPVPVPSGGDLLYRK